MCVRESRERMEVHCEPAIFVKAKQVDASHRTLKLTRLDQFLNYIYPSILFYKGSCSTKHSNGDLKEDGKSTEHSNGDLKQNGKNTEHSNGDLKEDEKSTKHSNGDYEKSTDAERDNSAVLQAVRHGLEAIVEHYPWVAGRLRTVKHIHASPYGEEEQECLELYINKDGGPGVQFVVARVNRPLHSLGDLSDPNPDFEPLFAYIDRNAPYPSRPVVAFQVSTFECGGFCVSMCSSHVLFDGSAASMFLQNMGSLACGKGLCVPLDLAPRELRIYPRNPPSPKLPCSWNVGHKKDFKQLTPKQASFSALLTSKKFVFTEHDLAMLRSHALSKQEDCKRRFQACTRLQVIIAHVWKARARCMMALYEDPSYEFTLNVAVNVRERVVASIPKNYVGNAFSMATPSASLRDLNEKSLAFVVEIIQDAIERVTSECFQSDIDHLEILGANAYEIPPPMGVAYLSNLGFYDIDFGWGKPAYFGRHFKQAGNRIIIMDGNAQRTSLNVLAAFMSEDELSLFQDALKY